MAEKTITKKTDELEAQAEIKPPAPKPKTKADAIREQIAKRGFATDRDVAELRG